MKYFRIAAGLLLLLSGIMIANLTFSGAHTTNILVQGSALSVFMVVAGMCLMANVKSFTQFVSTFVFWV